MGPPSALPVALMSLFTAGQVTSAAQSVEPSIPVIRLAGIELASVAASGRARSSTFRKLWHDLEAADWIVFVHSGSCGSPRVVSCLLHRIGAFEGRHYLRVVIAEPIRTDDEGIATLGHEFQHAVEVVGAPGISTSDDIRQLYRRIGFVSMRAAVGALYETDRAVRIAADIRRELRLARAAPVVPTAAPR